MRNRSLGCPFSRRFDCFGIYNLFVEACACFFSVFVFVCTKGMDVS